MLLRLATSECLQLAVRLDVSPGDGCLYVAMRLAGRNVHVILKLHITTAAGCPTQIPRVQVSALIKSWPYMSKRMQIYAMTVRIAV